MEVAELVERFPVLYHMAEGGSWPNIRRHGLHSTSALLDLYGVSGHARTSIESEHRPENATIVAEGLQPAVVRDQKPLNISRLRGCLTDMTVTEWLKHLNRRVFFWTSENRLNRLLGATPYKDLAHDVLTLETAPLVARYEDRITLAPYNTGATMPTAVARGRDTFRTIADYPFDYWRAKRPTWDSVVEVALDGSVHDIEQFVLCVEARRGTEILATLWSR